ncbi:tyrosine-protein kinase TXK-like [Physella acuta]|uniref:tyrosine-protein kinase TXK-like n=1 Tax=Physella acuta TaxID=109671 RepID=UPI0027DC38CB|nr:tyrosine-protein kinase TXK-like [Physella acuta]XP_059179282.1 tyrosine-protein kinase TXK-like [Physella acuta]XP_059179283.1 tyrosine-protein kinase TXK-like [Physella acuta]
MQLSCWKMASKLTNGLSDPVIKEGVLSKRAVIKRKTLCVQNYKNRLFKLTKSSLSYYEGDLQNSGKIKGKIPLDLMKVVMEVEDKKLEEKDNVFQIVYSEKQDYCTLYIVASSNAERYAWLDAIRTGALKANAQFFNKYHPGVWTKKLSYYNCCDQSNRNAIGCKLTDTLPSSNSLVPPPTPPPRPNDRIYIAVYDYQPTDDWGLELIAGEQYIILEDSAENWWFAKNREGKEGYIPSNYIKKNCGLEVFEWYYKDCSRERSKSLLTAAGKEGCFLVRESISSPGEYSLSIFTTENGGNVRHYQIKRNEIGQYYISINYPHNSIQELVHYHKYNAGGIYTRLRDPPPRGDAPSTAGFSRSKWDLDPSLLTRGRELGRGCFGVVYEGIYKNGNIAMPVAIKEMTVKPSSDEVFQEFKTMTQLSHPNLVQLYGVILNQEPQMIITELLKHGALNGYLQRHRQKLFYNQSKLLDFGLQVCCGMEYLDRKSIIHRDLAARNCLVGNEGVVKVGDFGLARIVLEDDDYQMSEGTKFPFKWAPPEVLYHRRFSSKSDVWAFGILLWEIYSCGEMPYSGMTNPEVLKYVAEEGKRLEMPRAAPVPVFEVMKRCWATNAYDRPTFTQLRSNLESLNARGDYIPTVLP